MSAMPVLPDPRWLDAAELRFEALAQTPILIPTSPDAGSAPFAFPSRALGPAARQTDESLAILFQVLVSRDPSKTDVFEMLLSKTPSSRPDRRLATALTKLRPQAATDVLRLTGGTSGVTGSTVRSDYQFLKLVDAALPSPDALADPNTLQRLLEQAMPHVHRLWAAMDESQRSARLQDAISHFEAVNQAPHITAHNINQLSASLVDNLVSLAVRTKEAYEEPAPLPRRRRLHNLARLLDGLITAGQRELTPDARALMKKSSTDVDNALQALHSLAAPETTPKPEVLGLLDRGDRITIRVDTRTHADESLKVALRLRSRESWEDAYDDMYQSAMQQVNSGFGTRFAAIVCGSSEYFNLGIDERLHQRAARSFHDSIERQGLKVERTLIANDADLLTMAPPLYGRGIVIIAGTGSAVAARDRRSDGTIWFHRWGGLEQPFSDHGAAQAIVTAIAAEAIERHQRNRANMSSRRTLVALANHWHLRDREITVSEIVEGGRRADYALAALVARGFSAVGSSQPQKHAVATALPRVVKDAIAGDAAEAVRSSVNRLAVDFVDAVTRFKTGIPPILAAGNLVNLEWWWKLFTEQVLHQAKGHRAGSQLDTETLGAIERPESVSTKYLDIARVLAAPDPDEQVEVRAHVELVKGCRGADFHRLFTEGRSGSDL